MGKLQRNKGATYEREVAHELSRLLGLPFKRVLGQERDGGGDVTAEGLDVLFECKRRKSLKGMYGWMDQVTYSAYGVRGRRTACGLDTIGFPTPVVVFRADNEESLVMFRLKDIAIVAAELTGDA